jgi:hypothetical protein
VHFVVSHYVGIFSHLRGNLRTPTLTSEALYISSLISLLHLTSHSPCRRRPLITGRKCLCNQLPGNLPLREVRKSDLEVSLWGHDIVYILCITSVPTAVLPRLILLPCHSEGHLWHLHRTTLLPGHGLSVFLVLSKFSSPSISVTYFVFNPKKPNWVYEEIKCRLHSGSTCYHLVQSTLFSPCLSQYMHIKIYWYIILYLSN